MYNNTNPAELYSGTTWELLTAGKYIQTGNTPLSIGGSNSVSIGKVNLPNVKLKIDNHSHTQPAHTHTLHIAGCTHDKADLSNVSIHVDNTVNGEQDMETTRNYAKSAGGENTGTASPSTETLGSGTALNIQPAYITLKFWKRLT